MTRRPYDSHGHSDEEALRAANLARAGCPVDQLGWYANDTLCAEERATVEAHLAGCSACRADVASWSDMRRALRTVSARTPEPRSDLFAMVEAKLDLETKDQGRFYGSAGRRSSFVGGLFRSSLLALTIAAQHFRAQARLIRRDLFLMPLLLLPLVGWIALALRSGQQASGTAQGTAPGQVTETAALIAALLAALGMAFLYGQEADPAREMVLATPTSPRLVLGVRSCLVFGYDLLLNCGVALPLLAWQGIVTPGWFLTNWLAPLCCLSALALLLSITVNPATAVSACVLLWALRLVYSMHVLDGMPWQRYYEDFWRQGPILFAVAAVAVLLAFGLLERKVWFAR